MSDANVEFKGFTQEEVIVSKKRLKCHQQLCVSVIRFYNGEVFELSDNWKEMTKKTEIASSQLNSRLLQQSDELSLAHSTIVQLTESNAALMGKLNVAREMLKSLKNELDEYKEEAKTNFNMLMEQCENAENELFGLVSDNGKLRSSNKLISEKVESLNADVVGCKIRIHILGERVNAMVQQTEYRRQNVELKYRNLLHSKKVADMENEYLRRQLSIQEVSEKKLLKEKTIQCNTLKRKIEVLVEQANAKKRFCSMM